LFISSQQYISPHPLESYHKTQSATKAKYGVFVEPFITLLQGCDHVIRLQNLFHLKEVINLLLLLVVCDAFVLIIYYYHDYLQPPHFAYMISSFAQITLNMTTRKLMN